MESPFLDVLTCMTEADLLLTQLEYEEWGDPRDPAAARRIQERCSYQGIPAGPHGPQYPPVLITYGLGDQRVPEWGPLKWAARVRAAHSASPSDRFGGAEVAVGSRATPDDPGRGTGADSFSAFWNSLSSGMQKRTRKVGGPVLLARRRGGGHNPTEADARSRAALMYAFLDKALSGKFE